MRHRSGLTVLELLITLAILGILMGVGYIAMRPNHALITAQEMQAMMRNARFEAVRRTRPVEVAWKEVDGVWTIQAYVLEPRDSNNNFDITKQPKCEKDRVVGSEVFKEFSNKSSFSAAKSVEIATGDYAVYWLPNGIAWHCDTDPPHPINNDLKMEITSGSQSVTVGFVGAFDVEVVRK